MDDEMDVMGLLRSLQRENAKNKLSRKDISQIIFQWYLKKMGFIQIDDSKFERRVFGINIPFEFESRIDDSYVGLARRPHASAYHGWSLKSYSLNPEQCHVEKDAKKLRAEMKRLHSNLRKAWENIQDDTTSSSSEMDTDTE
ncbi:uncharacterized protein LOC135833677 [Planococcus citri]|uniref:uncharacterized protein LOC135833677 n=1 Tax=Planococcus citri TaxID=170843 RepID=UPI0031F978E8